MAMHTVADVFSHSSYTMHDGKMTYISHELSALNEADNDEFVPARYASAKAVVKNVLKHYIEGTEGTVEDFILGNEYYDGSFKIRNLSTYASEIKQLDANQESILASVTRKVNQ